MNSLNDLNNYSNQNIGFIDQQEFRVFYTRDPFADVGRRSGYNNNIGFVLDVSDDWPLERITGPAANPTTGDGFITFTLDTGDFPATVNWNYAGPPGVFFQTDPTGRQHHAAFSTMEQWRELTKNLIVQLDTNITGPYFLVAGLAWMRPVGTPVFIAWPIQVQLVNFSIELTPTSNYFFSANETLLLEGTPQITGPVILEPSFVLTVRAQIPSDITNISSDIPNTGTWNSATNTFTLSGTRQQINTFLQNMRVTFSNVPMNANRIIEYTFRNSAMPGSPITVTQTLEPAEISLVVNGLPATYFPSKQTVQSVIVVDDNPITTSQFQLTATPTDANLIDQFDLTAAGSASVSYDSSTKRITIIGTLPDINASMSTLQLKRKVNVVSAIQINYQLVKISQGIPVSLQTTLTFDPLINQGVSNFSVNRTYTTRTIQNQVYAASPLPIIDLPGEDPATIYTIHINASNSSAGVFHTGNGQGWNSSLNRYELTGTKAQCQQAINNLQFRPGPTFSSNTQLVFTLIESGITRANIAANYGAVARPTPLRFQGVHVIDTFSSRIVDTESLFYSNIDYLLVAQGGSSGGSRRVLAPGSNTQRRFIYGGGGGAGGLIYQQNTSHLQTQVANSYSPSEAVIIGHSITVNEMLAVTSTGDIYTSGSGHVWKKSTSQIPSTGITNCIYSTTFNQWIAVGAGGAIYTSTNGSTWILRNSGTTRTLRDIIDFNGTLIAVGDFGTIRTSTNLVSWSSATSGTTQNLNAIAFGNTGFGNTIWAVGTGGVAIRSGNGTTWTASSMGVSTTINDLDWSGEFFIAVGNNGVIRLGTDIGWFNGPTTAPTNRNLTSVATVGNTVFIVGTSGLYASMNSSGSGFVLLTNTGPNLSRLAKGINYCIAVGSSGAIKSTQTDVSLPTDVNGNLLLGLTDNFVAIASRTSRDSVSHTFFVESVSVSQTFKGGNGGGALGGALGGNRAGEDGFAGGSGGGAGGSDLSGSSWPDQSYPNPGLGTAGQGWNGGGYTIPIPRNPDGTPIRDATASFGGGGSGGPVEANFGITGGPGTTINITGSPITYAVGAAGSVASTFDGGVNLLSNESDTYGSGATPGPFQGQFGASAPVQSRPGKPGILILRLT